MVFSLGPFITCFITIAFLTIYLYFVLYRFSDVLLDNTMKLVFIGMAIIFIRMLVPVNFPFTYTVYSTKILPVLGAIIYKNIGIGNLMIFNVLLFLWISIALILLILFIISCIRMNKYLSSFVIKNPEKCAYISELLNQSKVKNLRIAILPGYVSPAVTGIFRPIMVLPDISMYTNEEIQYMFVHEIEHYKNHDLTLKFLLEIVTRVHWWNPFVYVMKKQFTLAMEVSNDRYVAKTCPNFCNTLYAECILKIARAMTIPQNSGLKIDMSFVGKSKSNLRTRINYILKDSIPPKRASTFMIHLTIVGIVTLLSFTIVSDAYSPLSEESAAGSIEITKENSYLLETETGYDIYVDDKYYCTIPEIPELFENYHIYKKGEFYDAN